MKSIEDVVRIVEKILTDCEYPHRYYPDCVFPYEVAYVKRKKKGIATIEVVFHGHDISITLASNLKVRKKTINETYKLIGLINEMCHSCFFHINYDSHFIEVRSSIDNEIVVYDEGERIKRQIICMVALLHEYHKAFYKVINKGKNANREFCKVEHF